MTPYREEHAPRPPSCANCGAVLASDAARFCDASCAEGWRNGERADRYLATVALLQRLLAGYAED